MITLLVCDVSPDTKAEQIGPTSVFARRLGRVLKAAGYSIHWAQPVVSDDNSPLAHYIQVVDGIDQVDGILVILDTAIDIPDQIREQLQYGQNACKPIVLALCGGEKRDIPDLLQDVPCVDFRSPRYQEEVTRQLLELLEQPIMPPGELFDVPTLPEHYLRRQIHLDRLSTQVVAGVDQATIITSAVQTTALQGVGGIGKTVLAVALARTCEIRRTFHDGVFWITVGRQAVQRLLLEQAGQELGDEPHHYKDITTGTQQLHDLLSEKTCLFILDDVWDVQDAVPFKEAIQGTPSRLLVTTRNPQLGKQLGADEHQLDVLTPDQAVELLRNWSEQDDPLFYDIAARLGYLPLAIKLTGAQLRRGITAASWLRQFENMVGDAVEGPDHSLATALEMSAQTARIKDLSIYHALGIFGEDTLIPQTVIIKLWRQIRPDLSEADSLSLINDLVDLALLERHAGSDFMQLHDLLHDYVREQLGPRVTEMHRRLLTAYNPQSNPWPQVSDDGYLYDHLAYHLIEASQDAQLYALLTTSPAWMNAQYAAKHSDHAFNHDLELAIRTFKDPLDVDNLAMFVRLCIVRQVVYERCQSYTDMVLKALVWLDRCDEALIHARMRLTPEAQFTGLNVICQALAVRDALPATLMAELFEMARSIPSAGHRDRAFGEVALLQAQNRQYAAALSAGRLIVDKQLQTKTTQQVVVVLIQHHDHVGAIETACTIEDNYERVKTLSSIATHLIGQRQYHEALEVAARLAEDQDFWGASHAAHIRSETAVAMAQNGQIVEAVGIARQIEYWQLHVETLLKLANTIAPSGYAGDLLREALRITLAVDEHRKDERDKTEEEFPPQADDEESLFPIWHMLERAAQTAPIDDRLWIAMTEALLQNRDFKTAQQVVSFIRGSDEYSSYFRGNERAQLERKIVTGWVEEGLLTEALSLAQVIQDEGLRVAALCHVACAWQKTGDSDQARTILRMAIAVARAIKAEPARIQALLTIAVGQHPSVMSANLFDEAIGVAHSIQSDGPRAVVLAQIVKHILPLAHPETQPLLDEALNTIFSVSGWDFESCYQFGLLLIDLGQYEKAITVAQSMKGCSTGGKHGDTQVSVFVEAVQGLYRDNRLAEALDAANVISVDKRLQVLTEFAAEMVAQGNPAVDTVFQRLSDLVRSTESRYDRRYHFSLINVFLEYGRLDDALETARAIGGETNRSHALVGISIALARRGEPARAAAVFEEAMATTHATPNTSIRATILSKMGEVFVQHGELEKAKEIAQTINDILSTGRKFFQYADYLYAIAWAFVKIDRFDDALEILRLNDGYRTERFLEALAHYLVDKGQPERILDMAQQSGRHLGYWFWEWLKTDEAFLQERLDQILDLIGTRRDPADRIGKLTAIAKILISRDDPRTADLLGEALRIANSVEADDYPPDSMMWMFDGLFYLEELPPHEREKVEQRASRDSYLKDRSYWLSSIAEPLDHLNNSAAETLWRDAIDSARQITHVYPQHEALTGVVRHLLTSKRFNMAVESALAISDPFKRADACKLVVSALIAEKRVPEAHEVAKKIDSRGMRDNTLYEVVRGYLTLKDYAAALEVAKTMGHIGVSLGEQSKDAFNDIALALAEEKRFAEAVDVLKAQTPDANIDVITGKTVEILALEGRFEEALAQAQTISWPHGREEALSKIISVLLEHKRFSEAIETANWSAQKQVRSTIVTALAQNARFAGALEIASRATYESDRAELLLEIARYAVDVDEAALGQTITQLLVVLRGEHFAHGKTVCAAIELLLRCRRYTEALELAYLLGDDRRNFSIDEKSRSMVMSEISSVLAADEQFERAWAVAYSIDEGAIRQSALIDIANVLAQRGSFVQAFATIDTCGFGVFTTQLAGWAELFETVQVGFSLRLLRDILEIASWVYPNWQLPAFLGTS